MKILAIETSCDETAAAVLGGRKSQRSWRVMSNIVSSQVLRHRPFFGVVPELASRAHLEKIPQVVEQALRGCGASRCDAVAYTRGPGLAGALLVGKVAAETMAFAWGVPLIGVHHLEGHALALELSQPLKFPLIALIVSGGHTDLVLMAGYGRYRVLGRTRDDAAGEAFDKVAKLLRLGYPGGPMIDRMARRGNPAAVSFPRPVLDGGWDFSFSGLKTSVLYHLRDKGWLRRDFSGIGVSARSIPVSDLCASFQESVVDTVICQALRACRHFGISRLVVGGGVAANSRLRRKFPDEARRISVRVCFVEPRYCADNAAMIAQVALRRLMAGRLPKKFSVDPALPFENWGSRS